MTCLYLVFFVDEREGVIFKKNQFSVDFYNIFQFSITPEIPRIQRKRGSLIHIYTFVCVCVCFILNCLQLWCLYIEVRNDCRERINGYTDPNYLCLHLIVVMNEISRNVELTLWLKTNYPLSNKTLHCSNSKNF